MATFIADRYFIKSVIGQGGMGTVYLAEDQRLKRSVVIKRINTKYASLSEARLLAKVNHPNIVQIYDVVIDEEATFLVMEYVKGTTLYKLQKSSQLSLNDKLQFLVQICEGIAIAHQKGIVHCDIKSSNILINEHNQAKVADFGIAKHTHKSHINKSKNSFLSLGSASPEQLLLQEVDHRSDLFSFGILAYQLIYEQHPFGDLPSEQQSRIKAGEYSMPRKVTLQNEKVATGILHLLIKLLQVNPKHRPTTCSYVLSVFKQALTSPSPRTYTNNDTVQAIDVPINKIDSGKFKRQSLGAIIILFCMSAFFVYEKLLPSKTRYLLVMPAKLIVADNESKKQSFKLKFAIEDAIRQMVINTKHMELISNSGIDTSKVEEAGLITKASDIILPTINCQGSNCNVRIEKLSGKKWRVEQQTQWEIAGDDYLGIYSTTQASFATMYRDYKDQHLPVRTFSNENYLTYISLFTEVKQQGKYTIENMEKLMTLISHSPYFYEAYSLLLEVVLDLFHQNGDSKLLTELNKLLLQAPREYQRSPFFAISQFYLSLEQHNFEQAKLQLNNIQALNIDPYLNNILFAEFALKQHDLLKAKSYFDKAISIRRTHKAMFAAATTLFQLGEFKAATTYLNEINKESNLHYKSRVLLANIYLIQGKIEEAIALYEQEVSKHAQAETLNNLAIAYSLINKPNLALEQVRKIDSDNVNTSILLNIADVEKINGNTQQARKHYQSIINNTESTLDYYSLLDRAQALAQTGAFEQAISTLNQAVKTAPDSTEYAFTAALVYSLANEPLSAMVQFREALKSGYPEIWFNLRWFSNLCAIPEFEQTLASFNGSVCVTK